MMNSDHLRDQNPQACIWDLSWSTGRFSEGSWSCSCSSEDEPFRFPLLLLFLQNRRCIVAPLVLSVLCQTDSVGCYNTDNSFLHDCLSNLFFNFVLNFVTKLVFFSPHRKNPLHRKEFKHTEKPGGTFLFVLMLKHYHNYYACYFKAVCEPMKHVYSPQTSCCSNINMWSWSQETETSLRCMKSSNPHVHYTHLTQPLKGFYYWTWCTCENNTVTQIVPEISSSCWTSS